MKTSAILTMVSDVLPQRSVVEVDITVEDGVPVARAVLLTRRDPLHTPAWMPVEIRSPFRVVVQGPGTLPPPRWEMRPDIAMPWQPMLRPGTPAHLFPSDAIATAMVKGARLGYAAARDL